MWNIAVVLPSSEVERRFLLTLRKICIFSCTLSPVIVNRACGSRLMAIDMQWTLFSWAEKQNQTYNNILGKRLQISGAGNCIPRRPISRVYCPNMFCIFVLASFFPPDFSFETFQDNMKNQPQVQINWPSNMELYSVESLKLAADKDNAQKAWIKKNPEYRILLLIK